MEKKEKNNESEFLGMFEWCKEQALLYKDGKLEQWKIDKLNSIGFSWDYYLTTEEDLKEHIEKDVIEEMTDKEFEEESINGLPLDEGGITEKDFKALKKEMYQEYLAGNLDPKPNYDDMSDEQLYLENRDEYHERLRNRADIEKDGTEELINLIY